LKTDIISAFVEIRANHPLHIEWRAIRNRDVQDTLNPPPPPPAVLTTTPENASAANATAADEPSNLSRLQLRAFYWTSKTSEVTATLFFILF
jgi:hypothetical protein